MPYQSWKEAIIQVLKQQARPMQYTEIAQSIAELGLKSNLGPAPSQKVSAIICKSMKTLGDGSPFLRVCVGVYALRHQPAAKHARQHPLAQRVEGTAEELEGAGLVNAFGMYWIRGRVLWTPAKPRILGQEQTGSKPVDFCSQQGVYLLHDGRTVVYVGRTTDQPLGVRLRQHVADRLNTRWDRFSWFGVYSVAESGSLNTAPAVPYTLDMLIVTMEALLIEGLEPPQNRKRGDDFRAAEFIQVEDPEIQKGRKMQMIDELKANLG
jgi:HB1, ASXL, restriction endonuclease HTH domain